MNKLLKNLTEKQKNILDKIRHIKAKKCPSCGTVLINKDIMEFLTEEAKVIRKEVSKLKDG